nr:hypothetical protein [Trebonia kvetii]
MADVVQVDLRQVGRLGQSLEAAGDRVGMRRLAVLPAEQDAVIFVLRPEVLALLVEHFDVGLEDGLGERVQRQEVLRVLRLAVRLDHLAVDDDACLLDLKCSGVEVEQVDACARQIRCVLTTVLGSRPGGSAALRSAFFAPCRIGLLDSTG